MSSEFKARTLSYDSNTATSHRRLYSTILAEFPWYSGAMVLKPESLLAHCEELPSFEPFISSLHAFEDTLLHFVDNPHMEDIRCLLGVNVVTTTEPEPTCFVVASHKPTLSVYDFQKLCSVLCAYRLFEIISLRAGCISRIPISSPMACMFLPGPESTKDGLDGFSRLQNWPQLARNFQKSLPNSTDSGPQFRTFSNPLFSLMHMAARNTATSNYLAIEENFLFAAIHIAAMKNIPFGGGTLPDLPANMPSIPAGGFQDEESYERFETEFDAFIKNCQTEGCPSSTAHVGPRSPFQLASMISPLYLLVTIRLSKKSFHRRTVIDLAARLGPHKPPRVMAVESVVWDAIFRLAEGRISVSTVLQDLANSLPWSIIDIAANSDADKQWFAPRPPMRYDPPLSFPQLMSSSHFIEPPPPSSPASIGPGLATVDQNIFMTGAQLSLLPAHPFIDHAMLSFPSFPCSTIPSSALITHPDQELQRHLVSLPLSQRLENPIAHCIENVQTADTYPASSISPANLEVQADRRVMSPTTDKGGNSFASSLAKVLSTTFASAPPENVLVHYTVDPSQLTSQSSASPPLHGFRDLDFELENDDPGDAMSCSESNSEAGSHPGSNLHNTQSLDETHGFEQAAGAQSHDPDDSRSDRSLRGNASDSDEAEDSPSFSDGADTGPDYDRNKKKNTRKPITRNLQETARTSGARDPNPSKKRQRSPSSISPRGLGSKENPIDVDHIASLFEPIVFREYVKKEEISLPPGANPPMKGNRTYTVFDVTGEPISFNPSFHFQVYHERFRQFLDRVEASYDHNKPLHIARPDDSIIKSFTYEAWKTLTPVQMQHELRKKNIIVTGWPLKEDLSFNEDGLRKVAGTQSRQISINDYSIKPSDKGCGPTVVSGRVRDIWDNRHSSGKILNALDLPLYDGSTEPTEYASDVHAWDVTRGHHHVDQASSYPREHMRWALVGHENTMTFLHVDCEGLGTDVLVADGGKVWGFLRERPNNPLSSINFFLKDAFRLNQVLRSSDYDFEAVALRPRDKLFMLPCQPHFVYGYAHTICLGGHYYLTNHMQETLQGLIHSFILHKFLTNTSHPTRILLGRMIIFYHMGLVENEIPESDPAAIHLPDVNSIDGLMNLLSACVLVILGNVLDFRTYRAPTQEEYKEATKNQQILIDHEINTIPVSERFAICYARGVALRLINWIRHCSVITGPGGGVVGDLPSRFFIQITQALIKYKEGANASELDLQANCTLGMLTKQVNNVVDIDPHISSLWLERQSLPSDSLALANQDEYSVQWLPDAQHKWSDLPYDFFYDGVTGLDKCYFSAQQDRQRLESALVIPQLKTYSFANQPPSKRAKLG